MESQIFACKVDKISSKYFVILSSSIAGVSPAMIICQDRDIIIVEYAETGT